MKALGWLLDLHAAAKNIYDGLFFRGNGQRSGENWSSKINLS
jgi:hypothetical protein